MPSASLIDLSPEEMEAALSAVSALRARQNDECRRNHLVLHGSDAEILAEAQSEFRCFVPMVLAQTYDPGGYTYPGRELWGNVGAHRRRPVIMRGARAAMIARLGLSFYSYSPTGYAIETFWRYVRMRRLTFIDPDEFADFAHVTARQIQERHSKLHSVFWERTARYRLDDERIIIGGKRVYLTPSEMANVRTLHSIIRKTNKLDRRLKLASQHMKERLAA